MADWIQAWRSASGRQLDELPSLQAAQQNIHRIVLPRCARKVAPPQIGPSRPPLRRDKQITGKRESERALRKGRTGEAASWNRIWSLSWTRPSRRAPASRGRAGGAHVAVCRPQSRPLEAQSSRAALGRAAQPVRCCPRQAGFGLEDRAASKPRGRSDRMARRRGRRPSRGGRAAAPSPRTRCPRCAARSQASSIGPSRRPLLPPPPPQARPA